MLSFSLCAPTREALGWLHVASLSTILPTLTCYTGKREKLKAEGSRDDLLELTHLTEAQNVELYACMGLVWLLLIFHSRDITKTFGKS